jgi:hypothetical protein
MTYIQPSRRRRRAKEEEAEAEEEEAKEEVEGEAEVEEGEEEEDEELEFSGLLFSSFFHHALYVLLVVRPIDFEVVTKVMSILAGPRIGKMR